MLSGEIITVFPHKQEISAVNPVKKKTDILYCKL
jgi:hypothetical protein